MTFSTDRTREKPSAAAPEMPERVGKPRMAVFGGSFDPVHNGHLFIAGGMLRRELTEEVLLVPAKTPPHKQDAVLASAQDRLAMLELAVEPYSGVSISDIELNRAPGPSYTIDTMETLTRVFTEYDLQFVIGMDSLLDLHNWYRAGELANRFEFLICPRPGYRTPSHAVLNPHFGPRNARKLLQSTVDLPEIPISATLVRETAARQKTLCGLVGDGVARFIQQQKLYQKLQSPAVSPAEEPADPSEETSSGKHPES